MRTICEGATVLIFLLLIYYYPVYCEQQVTYSTSLTEDGEDSTDSAPISDHRFFIHEIFSKYGHDGQITFEGFEHLMENLKLGNVIIKDHDLTSHREPDAFVSMHNTHDHAKAADSPGTSKRGERSSNNFIKDLPSPQNFQSRTTGERDNLYRTPVSGKFHEHDHPGDQSEADSTQKFQGVTHSRKKEEQDVHEVQEEHESSRKHQQRSYQRHHDHKHDHEHPHVQQHVVHEPHSQGHQHPPADHHDNGDMLTDELADNITDLVENHEELSNEYSQTVLEQRCLTPMQILTTFHISPENVLNPISFLHLCPAIIYELDQQHCNFPPEHHQHEKSISVDQWLYSSLAVLIISLCGLFSVAVIPIMQKWFYYTLIQFLVGLAVGSLSGDALLHLMPHAMMSGEKGDHDEHNHNNSDFEAEIAAVWRGMAALGGIYFFFMAERLLNALTSYRRRKKEKAYHLPEPAVDTYELGETNPNCTVGEKLSHYRKNSYGLTVNPDGKESVQMLQNPGEKLSLPGSRHSSVHEVAFHGRSSFSSDPVSGALYVPAVRDSNPNTYTVTVSEHHGHSHGHSHQVPQSISAVAWMVIMGDGLHNFCDGMAIGVAFASGNAGGISTAVAVFCHELPHELGDFAMLLKTGMAVKQALLYNCLSSILCLIGMVIGVSLGNVTSATSWIFAATAGMFLYIALVDMLPELATPDSDPSSTPVYTLAVQILGISIGVSIMLLIAIYEHDLRSIVS